MQNYTIQDKKNVKEPILQKNSQLIENYYKNPKLDWLFFEITNACNLQCKHCASSCSPYNADYLSVENIERVLDSALKNFGPTFMVVLTGGEPLLHPQFKEIVNSISDRKLQWGITTNASLIDDSIIELFREAGLASISVSLDGLEETHDSFRNSRGNFNKTIAGLEKLKELSTLLSVTTVVHKNNINELKKMESFLKDLGIKHWRLTSLEPVGRGAEIDSLVPSPDDIWKVLKYIRARRIKGTLPQLQFGCSHYLSFPYEREVRDYIFRCASGSTIASVTATGDYIGCLEAPRLPLLKQGNVIEDDFSKIWKEAYKVYRQDFSLLNENCKNCKERIYCKGDSKHSWNYETNTPLICYKENFDKF